MTSFTDQDIKEATALSLSIKRLLDDHSRRVELNLAVVYIALTMTQTIALKSMADVPIEDLKGRMENLLQEFFHMIGIEDVQ